MTGPDSRRTPASPAPAISVIVPTHNPDAGRLQRTLDALAQQTLIDDHYEVIVVDNASHPPVRTDLFDTSGQSHGRIVREPTLGLTSARRLGFQEARGEICVLVDDDNVLAPTYLAAVQEIFSTHPRLGAGGGASRPEFATSPPEWMREFFPLLALRELGSSAITADFTMTAGAPLAYPTCAPIGAGMALRKAAVSSWIQNHTSAALTDRRGTALTSGGDNDLVLTVLHAGWQVGYFPELSLTHLIPASRLHPDYLARLNEGIQASWVEVLTLHDVCPWPPIARWTVPLRQMRAWFRYRGWQRPAGYIRWRGACGHFRGRAIAASIRERQN